MGTYAPTVAVDFDGVVHKYSKGWLDGRAYDEPVPGAFEGIRDLQRSKHAVFIFTTRDAEQVVEWFYEHSDFEVVTDSDVEDGHGGLVKFWNDTQRLLVTNRKLPAVAYLDDRAVCFTNWLDFDAQLAALKERHKR